MPIDTSIYSLIKPVPTIDPMKSYGRALQLRDLTQQSDARANEAQRQQMMQNTLSKNVQQGPDGNYSLNKSAALSSLYQQDPSLAMKAEKDFTKQDREDEQYSFEKKAKQIGLAKKLAWSIHDEPSYQAAREQAKQFGLPTDNMPTHYDPEFDKRMKLSTLDAEEQMNKQYKDQNMGIKRQELALKKQKMEQGKIGKGPEGIQLSEGEKAVDKDYAKKYTKYTATGRNNAINTIDKLEALAKEVAADTGFGESGGGRIASLLPDAMRSRTAVERRDDARNFANKTLKELFGGQLSDGEREAAAREYWNDSLDNESNAKRLMGKIKELRDNVASQDAQAEYYEKNRTLQGFASMTGGEESPSASRTADNFEQDVLNYAKSHGISPQQANAIKQQRMSAVAGGN